MENGQPVLDQGGFRSVDSHAIRTTHALHGPSLLIGEVFRRNAEVVPDRIAASLGDATLSHRQLNDAGNRLAHALHERGIRRGDRVVSWADTSLGVLPLFVALSKLGAVFAPLNARLGPTEAAEVAELARASLLVVGSSRRDAATEVAKRANIPLIAHYQEPAESPSFRKSRKSSESARAAAETGGMEISCDGQALVGAPHEFTEPALAETDTHVIFFTSGSTGRPKGVMLSHRANYLRGFQGIFRDEPEHSVCMFPLFHMAAFTLGLAAWQTRGSIHFVESASAEEILAVAEKRRANRLYCIPLVWNRILALDTKRFDLSALRELDTGTSATPIELIRSLKERFPKTVTRIYYGSTEVGAAAALADSDVLSKPGSVGVPPPGVDLRLSDAGEVCVRSAYLTDGYFDEPEKTAAALRDGWFHTGDIGALDEEGYLAIVGRLKELIRSGGESVAPAEVEAVLSDAAGVADVSVVGLPDEQWGEVVCAVVVESAGEQVSLEALQRHCEGRIAGFKKPRRLARVGALPRTAATGQVQRTLLVEQIAAGAIAVSD
jgi:fatty-acyl-CoA synthase